MSFRRAALPGNPALRELEIRSDGSGVRRITETPADVNCFDPCYLPEGRIVYCTRRYPPWQKVHDVGFRIVINP